MHANQKWTYCILGSGFAQNLGIRLYNSKET